MAIFKTIIKLIAIVLICFTVQTITFLTIGSRQLASKLLPDLMKNKTGADSIFIRDYYTTDCTVGDFYIFHHSLNLKNHAEELKKKLDVKFIYFADKNTSQWDDKTPEKYDLVYDANARSGDFSTLFGLYECRIEEYFTLKKNKHLIGIQRETNYRWFLFFWIQTHEYSYCWENKIG